jgi:hypothetical protein
LLGLLRGAVPVLGLRPSLRLVVGLGRLGALSIGLVGFGLDDEELALLRRSDRGTGLDDPCLSILLPAGTGDPSLFPSGVLARGHVPAFALADAIGHPFLLGAWCICCLGGAS